jgi:uncharacterized membrane protein YccC
MTTVKRLLRAAVRLDQSGLQLRRGLRYAAAVGAPLVVGVAVDRMIEGVAVSTGALLVGLTDSGAPYRRRVPAMLVASLVVATATLLGELVGAHDALTVAILALSSFVTGLCVAAGPWTYLVALIGPITFVGAASVPTDGPHAVGRATLVLAGGVLAVAFVMLASRADPVLPERVAVAKVYRAMASWLARGRASDDRAAVFLAVSQARDVLDGGTPEDPLRALADLGDRVFGELALLHGDRVWWDESDLEPQSKPSRTPADRRDAVVDDLRAVADQIAGIRGSQHSVSLGPPDQSSGARLSDVIADIEQSWVLAFNIRRRRKRSSVHDSSMRMSATARRRVSQGAAAATTATRQLFGVLGANLTLRSIACRHAIRLAVAATVASALARALQLPHDYWVPLTVLWLLRPDFGSTFTRGIQRYAGTTAGAVFATLFAAAVHPGPYALSALATGLSVGIFCFMLANYAVTGACVTGWVVFVSALVGIPEAHAAADRVLDTSLGAVLALGAYLLWPTWERAEVGAAIANVIDADRRYAYAVLGGWLDPERADREVLERCLADARVTRTNTEAALARSIAEPESSRAGLDPDVAAGLLAAMRRFCDGPLALEQSLDTADARTVSSSGQTLVAELDAAMRTLADAARTVRVLDWPHAFEGLRAAHRTLERELDANDPFQLQAGVMVAAVDDAAAALRRGSTRNTLAAG